MLLHIDRIALALRDDGILSEKLLRRKPECLSRFDFAGSVLASEGQVPVLGELFGKRQAVRIGTLSPIATSEIG
ncbi:MAG TPA: hypothetical protein VHC22_12745 [Pirellulales bacterium]|nr:hypothetical protein [Pirellulales bacterium]